MRKIIEIKKIEENHHCCLGKIKENSECCPEGGAEGLC